MQELESFEQTRVNLNAPPPGVFWVGYRSYFQYAVAGILCVAFLALGVAKIEAWPEIATGGQFLWLYRIAIISEVVIGCGFLLRPTSIGIWISALLLSGSFAAFTFFGPEIKECHCLGAIAEIGQVARLSIALLLVGLSSLGTVLILNSRKRC